MRKERNSSLELLKIFAIFFVIICHSLLTVKNNFNFPNHLEYFTNLSNATSSIDVFISTVLGNLGEIGNDIFFIISVWFLCDNDKINIKKIILLVENNFFVSILFLIIALVLGTNISKKILVFSLFPTIFGNNWYITCYIMILIFHPLLNLIVHKVERNHMKKYIFVGILITYIICFFKYDLLFNNPFFNFIILYLLIAYLKKYDLLNKFKTKESLIFVLINIVIIFIYHLILNLLGLKFSIFNSLMYRFTNNYNPFALCISLGIFNIFKNIKFNSKIINYVSSLSLFIYIFHDNIIFRIYFRPKVWIYFCNKVLINVLLIKVFIFALFLFFVSLIISIIYKATISSILIKMNNYFEGKVKKMMSKFRQNKMYRIIEKN